MTLPLWRVWAFGAVTVQQSNSRSTVIKSRAGRSPLVRFGILAVSVSQGEPFSRSLVRSTASAELVCHSRNYSQLHKAVQVILRHATGCRLFWPPCCCAHCISWGAGYDGQQQLSSKMLPIPAGCRSAALANGRCVSNNLSEMAGILDA
ncbi:hypothetical protein FB567DRAFT_195279 [Paraphoma chrysanthemicola]|uniref:Uncharacterized protein n=1 Tax=Paraphoma chrysanthemicola TaxID=798071 RepID=A0A8K0VTU9_9PLEO|nr:hypothetical protein FB567DRAFT_195279 [Paraphoma chrysanthemicola]